MLSKKNAVRIGTLYNNIFAGEIMCRAAMEGEPTKEKNESWTMWRKHCIDAVNTLQKEFGIKVVGY